MGNWFIIMGNTHVVMNIVPMLDTHRFVIITLTHNLCSNYHRELQKNVNLHFKVHTMRSIKRFPHKCPISKCHSSFASANELKKHLQIHNNDLRQCQYCAFRYVREDNYKIHLKVLGFRCFERLSGRKEKV